MRIHKMLAVAAGLAVAMLGTGVARADSGGLDPHAKITVPTDPDVIESCVGSNLRESWHQLLYKEANSIQDPALISRGLPHRILRTTPSLISRRTFL